MKEGREAGLYALGAAFVDGEICPVWEARIPLVDLGFLHCDVCYDVVHVWKGSFFRLQEHLDRFERSYKGLGFSLPYDREQIRKILLDMVGRSQLKDSYVYMGATRGLPKGDPRDILNYSHAFYAFAVPFIWIAEEEEQKIGIDLIVSTTRRIPKESVDPTIKNHHWGDLTRANMEALDKGAKTAVLLDANGNVTEGPGFNVFVVKEGKLLTPDSNVLEGITRLTVLELAEALNIDGGLCKVPEEVLRAADEIFLASTAGGVMPVKSLDDKPVGEGKPGSITMKLREAYWKAHEEARYSTPVNYD
ncbi:MAG: aminotransferase class IV [Candidatus Hydrogenedentota bacterium]|nr:MAG: aminotransferase class IV [Candidatus Hydrogenedentota bacterium]